MALAKYILLELIDLFLEAGGCLAVARDRGVDAAREFGGVHGGAIELVCRLRVAGA